MTDMPAKTVFVIAEGPEPETNHAIVTLQEHGMAAQLSPRGPNKIEAWFDSEDEWPPDPATECRLFSRVTEALAPTRFAAVEWGWQVTSALTSYVATDRDSGQPLGAILDRTQDARVQAVALAEWLARTGTPADSIKWRPVTPLDSPEDLNLA
ncbi:hypothetical protein ACIRJS_32985 [Streptomyces sp. NPDC102340]|uniref:hypothetical protein n=1 Tax=unclassified Streptomyces TaxID=2593676 RepID=UPI00381DE278